MALTPMIVIGCGGSGGKVVVGLRQRLEVELRRPRLGRRHTSRPGKLLSVDTPGAQETNMEFGPAAPERRLHLHIEPATGLRADRLHRLPVMQATMQCSGSARWVASAA